MFNDLLFGDPFFGRPAASAYRGPRYGGYPVPFEVPFEGAYTAPRPAARQPVGVWPPYPERAAPARRRPAPVHDYEEDDSDLVTDGVNVYKPVYHPRNPYKPAGYKLVCSLKDLQRQQQRQLRQQQQQEQQQQRRAVPQQQAEKEEEEEEDDTVPLTPPSAAPRPRSRSIPPARRDAHEEARRRQQRARVLHRLAVLRRAQAARVIQRAWRAYRDAKRAAAAVRLQAAVRAWLARRRVRQLREQLQQRLAELNKCDAELAELRERKWPGVVNGPYRDAQGRPRYQVLEYEELLTRLLLKVDSIPSDGFTTIRARRKQLVDATNRALEEFDRYKKAALQAEAEAARMGAAADHADTALAEAEDDEVEDPGAGAYEAAHDDDDDDDGDDVPTEDEAADDDEYVDAADEAAGSDDDESQASDLDWHVLKRGSHQAPAAATESKGKFRAGAASDVAGARRAAKETAATS